VHPGYQFTPQADRYDLALLKLDRAALLMPHVSPVCLPEPWPPVPAGERAVVAGWGATDPDSASRPKILQAVEVLTLENSVCMSWHLATGIRCHGILLILVCCACAVAFCNGLEWV
jgi:transmembrane serine protease 6